MSYVSELIAPRPAPIIKKPFWTTSRAIGILVVGLWALIGLALLWSVYSGWDIEKITRYGPRYFDGLLTTITLCGLAILIGAVISVPITLARMSRYSVLRSIAFSYIYVFRSTPLLAQLFMIYYGLGIFRPQMEAVGLWWFFREAWYCGILSLSLNTAAYQAEILRGALQSVPKGQLEGAKSLGLSSGVTFWKVVLPQAMIVALRPYGNEVILLIKGSAVVSIVTVFDLMGQTRYAFSRTYDFQAYLWAAVFYLLIVETLRHIWNWMERRLTRHLKR